MRGKAALLVVFLLVLAASASWAQTEWEADSSEGAALTAKEVAPAAPGLEAYPAGDAGEQSLQAGGGQAGSRSAVSSAEASGESVVDLAEFISAYVGESGQLPDLVQVVTGEGLRTLSAAEAFILLARTVDLWRVNGELPDVVPITPGNVARPEVEAEDISEAEVDVSEGKEIPTESFLDQDAATVRWVDQLRRVPSAVWVDGERLSAAEYLAGLAICLEYAYYEGGLLDTIFLPAYAAPPSWTAGAVTVASLPAEGVSEEAPEEAETTAVAEEAGSAEAAGGAEATEGAETATDETPAAYDAGEELAPATPPALAWSVGASQAQPQLVLFPEPGSTLRGRVDLVVSYTGPPATFVTFAVDEATRAIMNIPPYGYRWNTSSLPPGTHTVRVQVFGEGQTVLLDQVSAYIIAPPKPQATEGPAGRPAAEEAGDEL